MESAETRFAHLLQPIRELTKNWDVDVASDLNDYLEELDEMCITFDGGSIRMNFAEAALLIQGSTCIYSKKVELLHSLVYQTLEYMNDKNKKRNKEAAESQDAAAERRGSEEDEDEDDSQLVEAMLLPPHALTPPESFEKNKLPLISLKGEVLCSQKDFKINLYFPRDDTGWISPDTGSDQDLLPAGPQQQQQQQDTSGAAGAADQAGGDAEDENFLPLDDDNMEVDQAAPDQPEHVARHQMRSGGPMVRERRQAESDRRREGAAAPPAVDVWALHDPYLVLGQEKPLKPGKCYSVPLGLDDGGKRKRKAATRVQDFRSWFTGTFDPPQPKLKNGPKFTDFNYIYLKVLKDKMKTQRRIFRKTGESVSNEELKRTFLQLDGAGPEQQGEEPVERLRHPDLLGGDDDNNDDDDMFHGDVPVEFDDVAADTQTDQLSYEELVRLRVEQLVADSQGFTQKTALSLRVREWEDMMGPELDLQAQRPVFDIHEYGGRVLSALGAVGQRRCFSSIVHGLDNFEACKYLLATLQLANDYTVELDSTPGLEESLDSMGLTLLSTERATDRFQSEDFRT